MEWHRARGEFQKFTYFPGIEIAREIECELVGIGEEWGEGIQVVFRKRRQAAADSRG